MSTRVQGSHLSEIRNLCSITLRWGVRCVVRRLVLVRRTNRISFGHPFLIVYSHSSSVATCRTHYSVYMYHGATNATYTHLTKKADFVRQSSFPPSFWHARPPRMSAVQHGAAYLVLGTRHDCQERTIYRRRAHRVKPDASRQFAFSSMFTHPVVCETLQVRLI